MLETLSSVWDFCSGIMPAEFWYTVLGGFLSGIVGVILFFLQRSKSKKDEQQNILCEILRLLTMLKPYPNFFEIRGQGLRDQGRLNTEQKYEIRNLALRVTDKKLSSQIYSCDINKRDEREKCIGAIRRKISKHIYSKFATPAAK